jgi:uncharacterized protein YaiI (UPF0178 family)
MRIDDREIRHRLGFRPWVHRLRARRLWRKLGAAVNGARPRCARRPLLEIHVDADGCPVKDEVYRVAGRYGLRVWVIANAWLRVPEEPLVTRVVVGEGLDRADDWIAERIGPGDIGITADVPLASRCIRRGARVIAPNGRLFTEASIGSDLAGRNLMTALREAGATQGGGRPFTRQDRSRFLGALDDAIQAVKRTGR